MSVSKVPPNGRILKWASQFVAAPEVGVNNIFFLDLLKWAAFAIFFYVPTYYLMDLNTFIYFAALAMPGFFFAFATSLVWKRARRIPAVEAMPVTAKDLHISVLKPMCDLDPRLRENLESFANLSAPDEFQVFMCLARESDSGYPVAAEFAKRYPKRFKLVVGSEPDLGNPKISQVVHAMEKETKLSCNPFLWISESNVEASQEFMEHLVKTWKHANVENRTPTLVHAPLVGVYGNGIAARMERMCLSSEFNPLAEVAYYFDKFGVIGKTYFLHRDDVEQIGGLRRFGNFLGEDHLIGEAFYRSGRLVCCNLATRNVLGDMSIWSFFSRHARWAVMRRALQTGPFVLEPLINVLWPAVFVLARLIPSWCLIIYFIIRSTLDFVNYVLLVPEEDVHFLDILAVPLKEILIAAAWIRACFVRIVHWRGGQIITVGPESTIVHKAD
eukprot:TRINITY_DN41802_c0_g1_i1.p1 TRINITY_DN41802_c0_g1~~TRINITY_DN41802_c0_g1_i1.p1  ORF type:complete len:465 (-),score=62.70 TRINITY_DN41802_c0_g1_i1:136-1464(-)